MKTLDDVIKKGILDGDLGTGQNFMIFACQEMANVIVPEKARKCEPCDNADDIAELTGWNACRAEIISQIDKFMGKEKK